MSLPDDGLSAYVAGQLNALFPDGRTVCNHAVRSLLPSVKHRLEHCFNHINNKYFFDGQEVVFNHLHSDQYAMFLYLLASAAYSQHAGDNIADKLFLLNKALHGIDAFYEVELPSVFLFVHPLGTVLGRGAYSDFLLVYQRCSIGSNHDIYPELGKFVSLRPGAAVLGRCRVGDNCTIATESLLLDRDLPTGTLYIGNPRDFVVNPTNTRPKIWRTQEDAISGG